MPRTSVRIAEELHTALHHAGITGPYILVGSAFGGSCGDGPGWRRFRRPRTEGDARKVT